MVVRKFASGRSFLLGALACAAALAPAAGSPFERATPWVLDELFDLDDPYTGTVRPARVVRVFPGGIVVAHFEGDRLDRLPRTLALLDSAVPRLLATAVPLLREALVDATPRTSRGSGQYLVALRADCVRGPFAVTDAQAVDGEVFSRVVLTMVPYTNEQRVHRVDAGARDDALVSAALPAAGNARRGARAGARALGLRGSRRPALRRVRAAGGRRRVHGELRMAAGAAHGDVRILVRAPRATDGRRIH